MTSSSQQVTSKRNRPYQSTLSDKVDLLLGATDNLNVNRVELPLDKLYSWKGQPRTYFGQEALQQLASSLVSQGMEYPLIVRPTVDGYEVIAGERRFQAARLAKLANVPVSIRHLDDEQALEVALCENLDREDLNPLEILNSLFQLLSHRLSLSSSQITDLLQSMKYQWETKEETSQDIDIPNPSDEQQQTVKQVFERYGYNWYSYTCNQLKLRSLPDYLYEAIATGQIEYSKGLRFKPIKDESLGKELLEQAIAYRWSQREITQQIKNYLSKETKPLPNQSPNPSSRINQLTSQLKKTKLWKSNPQVWKKVETRLKYIENVLASLEEDTDIVSEET
ncbi:ParB/RepB/Spo0J family partition protein [Crocosphaera sp. UHCC 0190]|uniref:ParB/RepB/Spo0J family partition protein n=1 Tax=Crocosphaera sp. UHCC 0190 TaxID=3110246 RepID=UPI002B211DF9|nr:ParB/RepB/Spo0J family partition protein [Crocosphaera sp. UHCC 0190]MEA5512257.1 ParB/RepB/Spo0J family partition protein [Crocosphaera sp. UHCC 0190]